MVLAVPPKNVDACLAVFEAEDVEATVIGTFTDTRRLVLRYEGTVVEDAWMGDGRSELSSADIHGTLRLYVTTAALLLAGLVAARLGWMVP